ncbi:MAG TPA: hypothetical protein VEU51_17075 [Candidatus Acidoferrales bacterium]|nr:hypothetical protein [Candidatus Acidoferrales bacterium]
MSALTIIAFVAYFVAFPSSARAQEDDDGAWGGATSSAASNSAPQTTVTGCWGGSTDDTSFGVGSLVLKIAVSKNGKTFVKSHGMSRFDFEWPGGAFAFGSLGGKISGSLIVMKASAGKGCSATITGTLNQAGDEITGPYAFKGNCVKKGSFTGGTMDVIPVNASNCSGI